MKHRKPIYIDESKITKKTTKFVFTKDHLNDATTIAMMSSVNIVTTPDLIGTLVIRFGADERDFYIGRDDRLNKINEHPYSEVLHAVINVGDTNTFIRDGFDFERVCGVSRKRKGSDLTNGGDLKFYSKHKDIVLSGSVDRDLVIDQGKMLIIGEHPNTDPHHLISGRYIDLWNDLVDKKGKRNGKERLNSILVEYETWVENDRQGEPPENEYFRIIPHRGEFSDRLAVCRSAINQFSTEFYKNASYEEKKGMDAWIEMLEYVPPDAEIPAVHLDKVKPEFFTLKYLIESQKNGTIKNAWYQRPVVTGNEFRRKYIGTTVFTGECEHRGTFMFHENDKQKFAAVDGQQRLLAIYLFFNDKLSLGECIIMFNGKTLNFTGRYWSQIKKMATVNSTVREFVETVLEYKFFVRVFPPSYTTAQMMHEYRIANSGITMNRQELRAGSESAIGYVIRYYTNSASFRDASMEVDELKDPMKKIRSLIELNDDTIMEQSKKSNKLCRFGLSTGRMNHDKILAQSLNRAMYFERASYSESEDDVDKLYHDLYNTDDAISAWNKHMKPYLKTLVEMLNRFDENKKRTTSTRSKEKIKVGDRKGRLFIGKEEWDIVMFLTLELMLKHSGKKLSITDDVVSYILKKNMDMGVEMKEAPDGSGIKPKETPYGMSVRKEHRRRTEINLHWFPMWSDLLNMSVSELKKVGFSFN